MADAGATAPAHRMLLAQTRAEFLRLWRAPSFSVSALSLPLIFFILIGLPNLGKQLAGVSSGAYLLASFASYAVTSVMLASFGISLASERAQNLHVLVRASPLPPVVYLSARVLTAIAFAALTLLLLFAFGEIVGGMRLDAVVLLTIAVRLLLGAPVFILLGFAVAYLASPSAASAILNLIYVPLAFASGLFLPLDQLPNAFQQIAPYLFTYHYARLAWSAVGVEPDTLGADLLWLAVYGMAFLLLALYAFRQEEQRTFS
jgi:ABC-2 type transport system permease protein